MKIKWDLKRCIQEAKSHKTISSFKKSNKSAYNNVLKYNWKKEVFKHMVSLKDTSKSHIKYNFKKCKEEALKYKTRSDFHKNAQKAYCYALKNNFLDKVCSHMKNPIELMKISKTKWTYEKCKEEALKYKTRNNFRKSNPAAYSRSLKEGYLITICKHMTPTKDLRSKVLTKYSFELCKKEALKYKTKSEFRKKSRAIHDKVVSKKWLNKLCGHMKVEVIIKKRKVRVFNRNNNPKWTFIKCLKLARKYNTKSKFLKNHLGAYAAICKNGWGKKVFAHTISKGEAISRSRTFWNKIKCKKEALKYKSRSDFQNRSNGAYSRALKSGWLDEICKHMIQPNQFWSLPTLQKEALKYKTRNEFKTGSGGAYSVASNKNYLSQICKHMPQVAGVNLKKHEFNAVHKPAIKIIKELGYTYKKEYRLAKDSIIDLKLFHPKLNYSIAIELKRSDVLNLEPTQIQRYKKLSMLKQHNIRYLYFVDPQGKHYKKGFISFLDLKHKLASFIAA